MVVSVSELMHLTLRVRFKILAHKVKEESWRSCIFPYPRVLGEQWIEPYLDGSGGLEHPLLWGS